MATKKTSKKTSEIKTNRDVLKGEWKQLRREIHERWGELTDDDLNQITGKSDRLAGVLQERYGYSPLEANREIDEFLNRLPGDPTIDAPPPEGEKKKKPKGK